MMAPASVVSMATGSGKSADNQRVSIATKSSLSSLFVRSRKIIQINVLYKSTQVKSTDTVINADSMKLAIS